MTAAVIELLKLSLSIYFSVAKMNNATEAELDAIYQTEKDKFKVLPISIKNQIILNLLP